MSQVIPAEIQARIDAEYGSRALLRRQLATGQHFLHGMPLVWAMQAAGLGR